MNNEEYVRIIESAERLERSLFDLSSEENINRLEAILNEHSKKHGETMIGVPLVRRYGGLPVSEYILLSERTYKEMRESIKNKEIDFNQIHQIIGVSYDKERFDINRAQIRDNTDLLKASRIPSDVIELMKKSAEKAVVYKKPAFSFYP